MLTKDYADTESLLENVVPADILHFHGWKGANILCIGTLGLNEKFSINDEADEHKYFGLMGKDEEDSTESEDEEHCNDHHQVEAYSNYGGRNDDKISSDKSDGEEEEDDDDDSYEEEEWNPLVHDKSGAPRPDDAAIVINHHLQHYYSFSDHNNSNTKKKKKERITLAQLFSADSDYATTKNAIKKADDAGGAATKNATIFFPKKKLIPRIKQDSRPIQKLHRLMKRMLKRKIHPDVVDGKLTNKPYAAAGIINGIPSTHFGIAESVSLLQTQDATSGV